MSQPDASVIEHVNNHRVAVLATQRQAKSAAPKTFGWKMRLRMVDPRDMLNGKTIRQCRSPETFQG